ncbi:MAG: ABC transporter substrate-binding protein [Okeania sp. SIO3C4]|nr:ABC transporter substrate-binding protein [Okeania sp. SIO3C4]
MKKRSLFTLLLGLFIFFNQANAQLTIITGPEGSATYQMAQDIKTYCKIDIAISPTEKLVDGFRNLQAGKVCFMQYDILQNELYNDLKNGTKNAEKSDLLLPLGNEEIHLIALSESDIRDFSGLNGKKVGVGKAGETMRQTVQVLKSLSKSKWTDVEYSGREAIKALLNKEIDAMFFIGNAPDEKLTVFSKLPGANETLRLVPIEEKSLEGSYTSTTIRASTYKWADYQIETYAAKLVLVAIGTEDIKSPESQQYIKLLTQLKTHIKTLQRSGHRSWRRVSFVFDGLNWNRHIAAQQVFDPKIPTEKKTDEKKK